MIDWILKHPVLIFLVIAGVSSLLKKLKPQLDEEKPAPPADPRTVQGDFDEIERTRRIQDDIRRKIAERRGQLATPPPVPVSEPEPSRWAEKEEESWTYRQEEPSPVVETVAVDPVLERQRALAEQLAALQARHAAMSKASQAAWASELPAPAAASTNLEEVNWLRELRSARSLRKAIVLREVIGPPVALR